MRTYGQPASSRVSSPHLLMIFAQSVVEASDRLPEVDLVTDAKSNEYHQKDDAEADPRPDVIRRKPVPYPCACCKRNESCDTEADDARGIRKLADEFVCEPDPAQNGEEQGGGKKAERHHKSVLGACECYDSNASDRHE